MTIQFQVNLFANIKKRGGWFIAYCPPLDLTTQGKTLKEAQENIAEASELFIISCLERGTIDKALKELGFKLLKSDSQQEPVPVDAFQFPVPIPFFAPKHSACHA